MRHMRSRKARACGEDPPPHRALPREEADLDPEPVLHSRARRDRGVRTAVKKGVDVRVMMPSTGGSDNPMVQHAGHRNFEKLLRCGVRLFEYPHTLLHQKVMTVDGVWCAIGSSNFDDRSFETNDEITLGIARCRDGEARRRDLREVPAALYRESSSTSGASAALAQGDRQHVLHDQRGAVMPRETSGTRRSLETATSAW